MMGRWPDLRALLLWLALLTATGAAAQPSRLSIPDAMAEVERLVREGRLEDARKQLTSIAKGKNDYVTAYRLLGRVNLELGYYDEAIAALQESFRLNGTYSRAAYYECGEAYLRKGEYQKALDYFEQYRKMAKKAYDLRGGEDAVEEQCDRYLEVNVTNCQYALALDRKLDFLGPVNLGGNVNSAADDYFPSLSPDNDILLVTRRKRDVIVNYQNDEDIFISRRRKKGGWEKAVPVDDRINTDKSEGLAIFTPDGQRIYFTACNRPGVIGSCDLFEADIVNDAFGDAKPMQGFFNDKAWDAQPTVSCDGSMLIFSSNRNAERGADLYMCRRQADGRWGTPVALGAHINTAFDEEAPYLALDGKTLFFASDGLPGFGAADLYMSRWDGKQWGPPVNLGPNINSPLREIGFTLSADGRTALFASGRLGGLGGLDVYQVSLPDDFVPDPTLMARIKVLDANSGEPITGASFSLRHKDSGWERKTTTPDNGTVFWCLPPNKAYSMVVEKSGYAGYFNAEYFGADGEPVKEFTVLMQPKAGPQPPKPAAPPVSSEPVYDPYRFKTGKSTIYFEVGSASLSETEKVKIDNLLEQFKEYPNFKFSAVGFADETGTSDLNLELSRRRAQAVADYVFGKGVPRDRIQVLGKGVSTEQETYQYRKRRVEIEIVAQ